LKRYSKPKRRHHSREKRPAEDRRAEAVTVAWMLCTVATALAMTASLVGVWLVGPPATGAAASPLSILTPLMLFVAAVTGFVAFCLTPLVYFFRRVPPPLMITVVAVAIAISPLIALIVFNVR
jgi:hypothetical protein